MRQTGAGPFSALRARWDTRPLALTPTPYIRNDERDACNRQRQTEARIEEGDEPFGQKAACAQHDTAAHHDRHDDIALLIEEMPYLLLVFFEAADTFGMLFHELLEHEEVEHEKHDERSQQNPPYQVVVTQGADADVADVAACYDPNEARDKEEFFSRYLHALDYIQQTICVIHLHMNNVHF